MYFLHLHQYIESTMLVGLTLLSVVSVCPVVTLGALPQFSWDTLPVFFHSCNISGPYNDNALQTIAKYQMVTIEKCMELAIQDIDDEDAMVNAMVAVKKVNPKVSTYFYMSSDQEVLPMSRMAREFNQHPDYALVDDEGERVKSPAGLYVYDLSKPVVREWWQNICLNATKYANGDGCYCDGSQHTNLTFKPRISAAKSKAWGEGLLNLTREVQEALGDDKLLIGKVANQSFVKAVQLERFENNNDSINSLMLGAKVGQVMQAHVPINVSCSSDLTDYIAAFLIGAGEYCYFGCGNWRSEGNDTEPLTWRPEYDKPLGAPKSQAMYKAGVWTRSFSSGTDIMFDITTNEGTIKWGKDM